MSYMRVSYTLRIPDDLKRLMEARAKTHDQSLASFVVGACWAQLERGNPMPDTPTVETFSSVRSASGWPAEPSKPSMDALRAICTGEVAPTPAKRTLTQDSVPVCRECDNRMIAKMYKDIAVAYACGDASCPMYGLERKG